MICVYMDSVFYVFCLLYFCSVAFTLLGIKFGGQPVMSENLYLGKIRIEWVSSVKHLGNYLNSDMTDKTDCNMKCSSFIGYVNKLKANFGYLQPCVLGNLFKTFCCSFYGSPLSVFNC